MVTVNVRAAALGDLDEIVEVFLGCWRESYAVVLPGRLIDRMTDQGARELWERVVTESAPGDLLVATGSQPERVVGVARIGPVAEVTGHLSSLYVWPQAQGLGVGRCLMDAAMTRLTDAGATSATLWVFSDNAPSIAFYRRLGWAPDGHERTQAEFGEPELRMSRSLGARAPWPLATKDRR